MKIKIVAVSVWVTSVLALSSNIFAQNNSSESNVVDRFADVQVLRYEIDGFDKLSLSQRKLVYYLSQAGLSGRDIIYDQNNAHNLEIRSALEGVILKYKGNKTSTDWNKLMTYTKRVWFSNGIHHHYGMDKIEPTFSKEFFQVLLKETRTPLSKEALDVMFDASLSAKRKVKDAGKDMVVSSANNFYGEGVTQQMAEEFYASKSVKGDETPGFNCRVKGDYVETKLINMGCYEIDFGSANINFQTTNVFTEKGGF